MWEPLRAALIKFQWPVEYGNVFMAAQVLEFICKHFWSVLPFFGPEIHLWTFTRRDLFSFISVVVPNSGQPGKRWLSIWIHRFILIHPLVFDPGHFEAPISPVFWWQLQLTDRWLDRPVDRLGRWHFRTWIVFNRWLDEPMASVAGCQSPAAVQLTKLKIEAVGFGWNSNVDLSSSYW